MVPKSVLAYLDAAGVRYRVLPADRVPLSHVARAELYLAGDQGLLLVRPAEARVDPRAIERLSGLSPVRRATEAECAEVLPGCAPASVPPLGSLWGLPMLLDVTLERPGPIFVPSGAEESVLELDYVDLAELEDPLVAAITIEGEELAGPTFAQGALGDLR